MNLKITMALLLMTGTCAAGYAQNKENDRNTAFNFSLWGGYATVNMTDVNNNLHAANNAAANIGSVTEINNGTALAAEGTFVVSPGFSIGPRVEYLICNQGKLSLPSNLLLNTETKEDLTLVPVMLGFRYVFVGLGTGFSLSAGAFAGWGFAYGKNTVNVSSGLLGIGSTSDSYQYEGGAPVGNALLGALIRLGSNVSLGIDAGYRYAPVTEMKASEDALALGVRNGSTINDIAGNKLKFDFSGMILNAGLHFAF
jgi:hypothetical protein